MAAALLVYILAAFALAVTGTPMYLESQENQLRQYPDDRQYYREVRSQLVPQYVLPCAAAAAAAAAAGSPMNAFASPNHLNMPRHASYGHGVPHYRSVDEQMVDPEILGFPDMDQMQRGQVMMMDHVPMARTGYGAAPTNLDLHSSPHTPSSGIAYGVFPNAHVGGCSVPLLLSCSPSISSGHMVEHHHHEEPAIPTVTENTYRLVDEQVSDSHEHGEEVQQQHINHVHHTSSALQAHT